MNNDENIIHTQVAIIGAGPSGLGCAALLKQMGIKDRDLVVLDRGNIGESFLRWPESMKFITPSFPSNGYHQTDLNAITPDTSPAFSANKEHLNGKEYASYLNMVAKHYDIDVQTQTEVEQVISLGPNEGFELNCAEKSIHCQFLIWAGGEFQTPNLSGFVGADLCIHNSQIQNWKSIEQGHHIVIGAYESGVDAAYNLATLGNQITLLDDGGNQEETYDPSRVLSPYTSERLASIADRNSSAYDVKYYDNFEVCSVRQENSEYVVQSRTGKTVRSVHPPVNCTGFNIDLGPVAEFFNYQDNGYPWVNQFDESTAMRNLFLSGPRLFHDPTLLCFIYKFRGRFAAPCSAIAAELDLDTEVLKHYQQAGMLLSDLSCCENQECFC